MKKIFLFCIGLLVLTACKKETEAGIIIVQPTKYTIDNQGKATVSCHVTMSTDYDITTLLMLYNSTKISISDKACSAVDVISVIKDPKIAGRWNVNLGLVSMGDHKPYAPKSGHSYFVEAKVYFVVEATSRTGKAIISNEFEIFADLNTL